MLATSVLDFGCPKGPLASSEDANGSLAQQSSFLSCLLDMICSFLFCLFSPFSWFLLLVGGADFLPFPPALLSIRPSPAQNNLLSEVPGTELHLHTATITQVLEATQTAYTKRPTSCTTIQMGIQLLETNTNRRIPKMIGFQRYLISNMAYLQGILS